MSADTKAALDAAISAHMADVSDGNIVPDYALVIGSTALDDIGSGRTRYYLEGNDGQPVHVSYGLLSYVLNSNLWDEDDEDD